MLKETIAKRQPEEVKGFNNIQYLFISSYRGIDFFLRIFPLLLLLVVFETCKNTYFKIFLRLYNSFFKTVRN